MDPDPYSLPFILSILPGIATGVVLLALLLLTSALVSGAEIAFFTLDNDQLRDLAEEDDPKGRRILKLREKSSHLLASILITNNVVNISIIVLSFSLLSRWIPFDLFINWGDALALTPLLGWWSAAQWASAIHFVILILGISFLLVFFGELVPKIYANINRVTFAKRMSRPLQLLVTLLSPLSAVFVCWGNALEKKLKSETNSGTNKEDIDKAIDLAVASEKDSKIEADMLKSIVAFNEVAVKQIMRSRMDIIALDVNLSLSEMLMVVRQAGYSRLPVYEEELDNIRGILYVKDLIGYIDLPAEEQPAWPSLVRQEVLYVPESRKISDLLKDFQREHLHMAIVVDEYGGTSGIVTMEDVIEEVIGDIKDEFDEDQEVEFRKLSDTEFIFEGKTMLIDVCRVMHVDKDSFDQVSGDADSLAGLVLELNGRMPAAGQTISFPPFTFTVLSVSPKRIERIKVRIDE